jgi:hypothetical protein
MEKSSGGYMTFHDGPLHKLQKVPLPDAIYPAIGRLVRVASEFEDVVLLYISRITGNRMHVLHTLLGQAPISKKIEAARYLATIESEHDKEVFDKAFGKEWEDFNTCRNAVAHGRYVGMVKDREYAFALPANTLKTIPNKVRFKVLSFGVQAIEFRAEAGAKTLPTIRKMLGIEELHEQLLQTHRELGPIHRKQQSSGGKRRNPPQSRPKE